MKVFIGPYPDEGEQEVDVHIDKWDTWSMDHTLAYIIVPMLKQLKATKHGAPFVDNEDVPEEWRMSKEDMDRFNKDGTSDDKFFGRYDWVLDEMIWAFEQKNTDWESEYYEFNPGHKLGDEPKRWDSEGMKKHQERISNGFRLFGKYYETLWD